MKFGRTIDPHCPSCHGKGEVSEGRMRDGEWWESFFQCHCVEYHHDDEMKAFLKRVTALARADHQ